MEAQIDDNYELLCRLWSPLEGAEEGVLSTPTARSTQRVNGLMYSDSLSKSEILNKQFQSVFTKKITTATPRLFGNKLLY